MILKALYDYYERAGDELPREGYRMRPVDFTIVLDREGHFAGIEDNREEVTDGKKTRIVAKRYEVLRDKPRTSGVDPNFLWDKPKYVLNVKKKELQDKPCKDHVAFVEQCYTLAHDYHEVALIQAIRKFYANNELHKLQSDPLWSDIVADENCNISFKLKGGFELSGGIKGLEKLVEENDVDEKGNAQLCLVTGECAKPVRLCMANRIPKCGTNKPKLISFMEGKGYDSYGKSQCYNAPMSWKAAERINIAMERLADGEHCNHYTVGNRTFLFWATTAREEATRIEESFFDFLSDKKSDDPNAGINAMIETLRTAWTGKRHETQGERFYVLGVYPNMARMVVTYWQECSLAEFAEAIKRHLDDTAIAGGALGYGIYSILSAITLKGDIEKEVAPHLPEMLFKAVLNPKVGYPYPIYTEMLRRFRVAASQHYANKRDEATYRRKITVMVAFIKAFLNRQRNNHEKPITMSLDKTNENIGYLCGRLFAVLDRIQEIATGGNVRSIRERYMNAASATPGSVFPTILKLSRFHSEKIDNNGAKIFLEKMKQEIFDKISGEVGFPVHLSMQDQGRFAIGYYHQRQDFFEKKDKENENDNQ